MAETNTFSLASGSFAAYWSRRMQRKYYNTGVFKALASFEEQPTLKKGYRVHRPLRSELGVNDLGADGLYSRQALIDTDEYLDVDTKKEVTFNTTDYEEIQHNYKVRNEYADEAGERLGEAMDGDFLSQIANADSSVDETDIGGGTAENGVTPTATNIYKFFSIAGRKLSRLNVPKSNRVAVIGPEMIQVLEDYRVNRDTADGDKVLNNGFTGMRQGGFDIYESNGIYWTGSLAMGTLPTEGDTVVISDGITEVTFTFNATLGSDEGDVHITSSAATQVDLLVAAINAPTVDVGEAANTGFTAFNSGTDLSIRQANLLKKLTASDGTTTLEIVAKALGYLTVTETLTASADVWTAESQIQECYFGRKKAVDMVVQKYPNMAAYHRSGYVSHDIVSWNLYGIKSFDEGDREMCRVLIRTDAF